MKILDNCTYIVIITFLSLFITEVSFPQYDEIKFEHIRVEDGLPVNSVTCILQDHFGFLWLGTPSGLVKYDGYSMIVYRFDPMDSSSISDDNIRALCEDSMGILWIGTKRRGLNSFDRANETFKRYVHLEGDTTKLNSNTINCIYHDKAGRIWIGTDSGLDLLNNPLNNFSHYYIKKPDSIQNSKSNLTAKNLAAINSIIEEPVSGNLLIGSNLPGLWLFDLTDKSFSKYKLSNGDQKYNQVSINNFHQARNGTIWIGTNYGLVLFNQLKKQFNFYGIINSSDYYPVNDFKTVFEDQNGFIWVGTYGQGLASFNPQTKKFIRHQYDKFNSNSLYGYWIFSVYVDFTGILWTGIDTGGLDKWDKKKWKFKHYKHNPRNSNSLCENWVASICEDQNGMLWVGTEGGLDQYDQEQNKFTHYLHDPLNSYSLSSDSVWSIVEDPDERGVLWIGTWKDGLNKFDPDKRIFTRYQNDPTNVNSLSHNSIISMIIDHEGILWIATWGGGLNRFDRKTERFKRYQHNPNDPKSLSHNKVSLVFEDKEGTLWIGTDETGLNRFDRNTETFTNYRSIIKDKLSSPINCIYEDQKGNIWLGTYNNGLHLFDRNKGVSIKNFDEKDGLASNCVTAILGDESGSLWISTSNGLSNFNPVNETFRTYGVSDGLAGVRFNRCAIKSKSGEMLFGGADGLNIFHPDSVRDDPVSPNVVISNVSLFNRPGEKLTFEKYVAELDEIKLSYNQNDLRFDFVGLHFSEPLENLYKYTLQGFDENWIEVGTQQNAVYTNLDPGEYTFKVTAANRDGIWNEKGASIKLIISPPYWATTWANIVYGLIIIGMIYFTWKLQLKRIRIKNDYEMSKFEAEKMHEVDEMKNRFFANISHEFRTPLTLIFGPAKDIAENSDDKNQVQRNAGIIKRNASRLYSLVNQLLDLSKLESGKMKLEASEQDIIPLLKGIFLSFTSFAERKKITLKFNTIEKNLKVYLDRDKLEKIINNLLSNAFKFTPEGGEIDFTIEKMIKDVEIRITDNGIGITEERIDKIFDRFYQVDSSHTRQGEGTGIGLALTKELVELHKGKIKVESKEGEGTTVTVQLQLGKNHLKTEEIVEKQIEEILPENEELPEPLLDTKNKKEKTDIYVLLDTDKPLLLVVEDNPDVRSYIISHLEEDYRIQEAVDGEDGLNQAIKHIPDLIISDVMMPKMDGFRLCNKLKTDERTSHIPIIMLTAKATSKDKIEGYELGADDYIMKPFDAKELSVRINNLIEQRKRLRDHFRKQGVFEIDDKAVTSIDKKFLNKLTEIISKHISDTSFNVDMFSDEIGMSRSQLHRKLVALVGEPPSDLIRRIRLSKAAGLIIKKFGNISEIALEVGFNNPANFANSFRKQFGVSPSEYENRIKS
jgi:signal transduction histidine kinase/ligand-binding sensor domain-containing protein/DNA-binding response OmpR family regulator